MMMRKTFLPLAATAAISLSCLPGAFAQEPASIQGHANDEVGNAIKDGEVRLTQDINVPLEKRKYPYAFKTDADGNFKGTGIAPGSYLVNLFRGATSVDFLADQAFKAGETKTENFDMTREEYMKQLTPERRKQIEDFKAKNAEANNANKQVANLNATLTAVRTDLKSPTPNFDKDVADAKSTTTLKPDEPLLWVLYGDALTAKADHGAAEDRTNKVNPNTDDAVKQNYSDAIDAYKKAGTLMDAAAKKPTPEVQATVYNELGNAQGKSGAAPDAVASFDKAAALQPQNAGMFYANAAAVLFNAHQDGPALDEANKAIAADPNRAAPYYIKGQELLQKATVDKAGKIQPPPGCVDAYQKYLELAPDGPQAAGVKETLTALGEKVQTHYTAAKKGK